MERQIGMGLEFFGAFILILILVCCLTEQKKTPLSVAFAKMAGACVIALLSEAVTIAMYERSGMDMLHRVLNCLSFASGYAVACAIRALYRDTYRQRA